MQVEEDELMGRWDVPRWGTRLEVREKVSVWESLQEPSQQGEWSMERRQRKDQWSDHKGL